MKPATATHHPRGAYFAALRVAQTRAPLKGTPMKYGLAWLVGVPPVLIVGWFLLNRC